MMTGDSEGNDEDSERSPSGPIEVVRAGNLQSGVATPGILRQKAFDKGREIVSKSTVSPGIVSSWHHHGSRRLYGFVVSGRLMLDFGEKGLGSVEVRVGDFFHIPPGIVHRDVNPDKDANAVVVNILVGDGPAVVNVDSPRGPAIIP